MHIPTLPLPSSKRTSKRWFYSLDSQSQYFLSALPTSTFPSLQELRCITGTEPVYYQDTVSAPIPPTAQASSFDTPRLQVLRVATADADVVGKRGRGGRSVSFSQRWGLGGMGKGGESSWTGHVRNASENLLPRSQEGQSSIYPRDPSALHRDQNSFSSSSAKQRPARPSLLRNPFSSTSSSAASSSQPTNPFRTPPASHTGERESESDYSSKTPPHPHHSRIFHAKNLRCMIHTGPCPLCDESCCAYRKAVDVWEAIRATTPAPHTTTPNHKSTTTSSTATPTQQRALKTLIQAMREATPPKDREERTFICCSECARWVCPGCIGVCPVGMCGDMVCGGCKVEPWGICGWHDIQEGGDLELGGGRGELGKGKRREKRKEQRGEDGRGKGKEMKRIGVENRFFRRGEGSTH